VSGERGKQRRAKGKEVLLSTVDVGGRAEYYAFRPYDHYRDEVYESFVDMLRCLPLGSAVLGVGAGPGHLAHEFFQREPRSDVRFVLLDASAGMLGIAAGRLAGRRVSTVQRSFNTHGWDQGLGQFDAIVSNNALFHVRPGDLEAFYGCCYGLLRQDGLILNQQSLAWEEGTSPQGEHRFSRFMRRLPETILPSLSGVTEEARARLAREQEAADGRWSAAVEEAKEAGVEFAEGATGYQFLTVEAHLDALRRVGFAAGCIWRKREFAVLCGTKGEALGEPDDE
jgi:SAM-dependent methyltransferase